MNSYTLDLRGGSNNGFDTPDLPNLRKVLGYIVLFGKNVQFIKQQTANYLDVLGGKVENRAGRYVPVGSKFNDDAVIQSLPSIISFDLDFSLSNIQNFVNTDKGGNLVLSQDVYDTRCQSVREYVDKPYPIKGYLAVATVHALGGNPTPDMDDYVTFNYNLKGDCLPIYIGKCNSSQTDFYTPFSQPGVEVTIVDIDASFKTNGLALEQSLVPLRR